jgi:hypothetical protein
MAWLPSIAIIAGMNDSTGLAVAASVAAGATFALPLSKRPVRGCHHPHLVGDKKMNVDQLAPLASGFSASMLGLGALCLVLTVRSLRADRKSREHKRGQILAGITMIFILLGAAERFPWQRVCGSSVAAASHASSQVPSNPDQGERIAFIQSRQLTVHVEGTNQAQPWRSKHVCLNARKGQLFELVVDFWAYAKEKHGFAWKIEGDEQHVTELLPGSAQFGMPNNNVGGYFGQHRTAFFRCKRDGLCEFWLSAYQHGPLDGGEIHDFVMIAKTTSYRVEE